MQSDNTTPFTEHLKTFRPIHPDTFKSIPFIQSIANEPRWTVSDEKKRPLDAKKLLSDQLALGARKKDGYNPLVTLDELNKDQNLTYVNRTFHMSGYHDKYFMLDVEPTASDEAKKRALSMPSAYTEVSKNGGVHVFIQVPESLLTNETRYLFELVQFKDKSTHWEVFFNNHYVTFTRKALKPKTPDYSEGSPDWHQIKKFLDYMVQEDKESKRQREQAKRIALDLEDQAINKKLIKRFKNLLSLEHAMKKQREKAPENFENDLSLYEYHIAVAFAFKVKEQRIKTQMMHIKTYDALEDIDFIYLIAELTKECIEERSKHEESRDGLPWLMYNAKNAWSYALSQPTMEKRGDE